MTKIISEEIIKKIKKLPETHKQEIQNIGLVLDNLRKEYFDKISSPVAREIEEHLFRFILNDVKLSNLIPFYRATLKNGVLFWDYQNNKAGIHLNEFYRLFDDFFPETEEYPQGVSPEKLFEFFESSLNKLPNKSDFFKFEFSFDDFETFEKGGFSLFYNIEDETFSIYPIPGRTLKITEEKMVFETDSFAITTTMPGEFLLVSGDLVENYIVNGALSTCERVVELIQITNAVKEEHINNLPDYLRANTIHLEMNSFINKGLISSRGIFPYSLLKEDQEKNSKLMNVVKAVDPFILSKIISMTNEMIDVFL